MSSYAKVYIINSYSAKFSHVINWAAFTFNFVFTRVRWKE